jgi:NAD(P)-dependent dehydrogenase (short-subunit alcohol dehydrogenase family)
MSKNPETKTILITGTSTGIGYGAAKTLAAAGYRVVATVRTVEDAERLRRELGDNVHPVLCDVTQPDQVAALPEHVKKVSKSGWLDVLVNNAAIELIAPAELQPMEEIRAQFETNVFGLIAVTKALLPLLGSDATASGHRGRIINVSSVGGVLALPLLSAYVATKFAVEGYSHSLRRELRMFGIDVVVLGPGAVKSEIWNKHLVGARRYDGTRYELAMAKIKAMMQTSERTAFTAEVAGELIRNIVEVRRPKPRYVLTPGKLQNWTLPAMMPHGWVDGIIGNMLGLGPEK